MVFPIWNRLEWHLTALKTLRFPHPMAEHARLYQWCRRAARQTLDFCSKWLERVLADGRGKRGIHGSHSGLVPDRQVKSG